MDFEYKVNDLYDEGYSKKYRDSDELLIQYGSRRHYCDLLREISISFDHKIFCLDVGCGTGRYFHCLKNVRKLVGIDISRNMLNKALNPVNKEEMDVENIELICGNIYNDSFSNQCFDFIYSLGVIGEYAPFNMYLCTKLFKQLKTPGKLFFTIVDIDSRIDHFAKGLLNKKKGIFNKSFAFLPSKIKEYLNRKISSFYMSLQEIQEILERSNFLKFEILRYEHPTASDWKGAHYDCLAFKE